MLQRQREKRACMGTIFFIYLWCCTIISVFVSFISCQPEATFPTIMELLALYSHAHSYFGLRGAWRTSRAVKISGSSIIFYSLIKITTKWRWWLANLVMWQAESLFDWSGIEYYSSIRFDVGRMTKANLLIIIGPRRFFAVCYNRKVVCVHCSAKWKDIICLIVK